MPSNSYLKYTGMAFQMFALLLIAVFLGQKLDEKFQLEESLFTIFLSLFALVGYLVKLYIDVTNNKL